jgi:hypothetical protein
MTSWTDFAAEQPELADLVRRCFAVRKHATLATLRRDGSPRISGTEVQLSDAGLFLGSMSGAVKALDLRRDPRFALHCPTVDAEPGNESAWLGDAKLSGTAREVPHDDPEGSHRFELDLLEVVHTSVDRDRLLIQTWHPGRGLQRVERR